MTTVTAAIMNVFAFIKGWPVPESHLNRSGSPSPLMSAGTDIERNEATLSPGLGLGLMGAFVLAGALGTILGGVLVVAAGLKKPADNSDNTSEHSSSDQPQVSVP